MNEQTLVAVYDTAAHADAAVSDLRGAAVPSDFISQHTKNASVSGTTATGAPVHKEGFWANLFGGEPDHDTTLYDRSIETGSTVVTVRVPGDQYDRVSAILERHNPIDLDERASQYGSSTTTTTRTMTAPVMGDQDTAVKPTDDSTLQLSEETLSVGKRAVSGGTTRIRRYVVETPVEEQVTLHSEKVTLDRRPVSDGRPVGNADFTDKMIEMTETSEEAVVSKTARVTEEVSLRKQATDRVETVKDTVRREDVEIEEVPGSEALRTERAPAMPQAPAQRASKI